MAETIFVISDLHLGGDKTFAICGTQGQKLLADFLHWVASQQSPSNDVHLVVNGDSVDFLAQREFLAFTPHDTAATKKLKDILDSTEAIWKGFAAVLRAGARVTFTLGNHDLEFSLPGPRRLLKQVLGRGEFEFLYDNQALAIGDVLIEHGNRYDRWNVVDHNGLRHARVLASLGRQIDGFEPPPGSRLVIDVMNGLKEKYAFINLLKPENQAAVPMLAVLDPSVFEKVADFARLASQATEGRRERDEIAAHVYGDTQEYHADDRQALDVARSLALGDTETISFGAITDFISGIKAQAQDWYRRQQIEKLYKAFRYWMGPQLTTFDTGQESKEYYDGAMNSARDGFKVILYGHTHLAKRIPLPINSATYINTGTWADLMCVPTSILFSDKEDEAKKDLEIFVRDLENNRIDQWTNRVPTFAQVRMENGKAVDAGVFIFGDGASVTPMPDGRLSRLLIKPTEHSSAAVAGGTV